MTTTDIARLKGGIKDAILNWAGALIDELLPSQATARALLKNGAKNFLPKMGKGIDNGIDALVLMLGDEKGAINSDTIVDTLCTLLQEMPQKDYNLGAVSARIGEGAICVDFPKGFISEMLVGNLGGVKITAEDIQKIKDYIK